MKEEFVSEAIEPVKGTSDTVGMSSGEPGLPGRFVWRDKEYVVDKVLEKWQELGPDKGGSGQMYLRKHWFKVKTCSGAVMTLYFERQGRSKRERKMRWWLYTICSSCGGGDIRLR